METGYSVHSPLIAFVPPPSVSVSPFGYLRSYKSDFDAVKSKVGLFPLFSEGYCRHLALCLTLSVSYLVS